MFEPVVAGKIWMGRPGAFVTEIVAWPMGESRGVIKETTAPTPMKDARDLWMLKLMDSPDSCYFAIPA